MTDKQNKSTFNNISVISKRFGVPWTKSKTEYQRTHQPVTSSSHKVEPSTLCRRQNWIRVPTETINLSQVLHTKLNQVHFVEDKTGSEYQEKPSTCRKFFTQSWTKYTLSWAGIKVRYSNRDKPQVHHTKLNQVHCRGQNRIGAPRETINMSQALHTKLNQVHFFLD